MSKSNISQLLFRFVFLVAVATVCAARPPSSNSFGGDQQLPLYDGPHHNEVDVDNSALDGLQLQLLNQQLPVFNPYARFPASWERLRMPETKRQKNYRQCYFNPVSCFRK